jgi:6,7-dimethyl-8-ribityllumazine synthase
MKIALVVSEFNTPITSELQRGAYQRLLEKGWPAENISITAVPGAIEIPLVAQRYAQTNQYAAVIALGAVIRGETSHYDVVCAQASQGCQQVALTYDLPVVFGVLTTDTVQQALDRLGGRKGHKGIESADCALRLIEIMRGFATGAV